MKNITINDKYKRIIVLFTIYFFIFIFSSVKINAKQFIFYNDYNLLREFFYPIREGTKNERKLFYYIENFCKSNNLVYKKTPIKNDYIVTNSFNLEIYIKGSGKKQENIVVICPIESPIIKQNYLDNSISIDITLNLILSLKKIPLQKNLIFLFSGGNEKNKNKLGIETFLLNNDNLTNSVGIIVDILSYKSQLYFSGSVNKTTIPSQFLKTLLKLEQKTKFINFDDNEIINSKLGFLKDNIYLKKFINKSIPSVIFSNKVQSTTGINFSIEEEKSIIDNIYLWILSLDNLNFDTENDTHYQYFNLFGLNLIFSETFQVIIFVILIFLFIGFRIFGVGIKKHHLTLFVKILPMFLIIFILFFILSFIPTIFFTIITFFTHLSYSFFAIPLLYFVNAFFIPQIFMFLLFESLNKLPFPKHNYLYLFGAIIFAFVNLFIITLVDISFTYLYLWVLIMLTLSQISSKNFFLKFLFYALSPIPLLSLAFNISLFSDSIHRLSANPFILNFLVTFFSFPFILLNFRIHIILRSKYKIFLQKSSYIVSMIIVLLISIVILLLFSYTSFHSEQIVPVTILTNTKKKKSVLQFDVQNKIKKITISSGTFSKEIELINNSNKNDVTIDYQEPPFTINHTLYKRFHYDTLVININSKIDMEKINLYLVFPKSFYPLSSNFKYRKLGFAETAPTYNKETQVIYSFLIPRNIGKKARIIIDVFHLLSVDFFYKISYSNINNLNLINDKNNSSIIKKISITSLNENIKFLKKNMFLGEGEF